MAYDWKNIYTIDFPDAYVVGKLAYDPVREVVVCARPFMNGVSVSKTIEWDGTNWVVIDTPSMPTIISGHCLAWDSFTQKILFFGGTENDAATNETWTWDGSTWTQLNPTTSPPEIYFGHHMCENIPEGGVISFAGWRGYDGIGQQYLSTGTWTWDGSTWTERITTNEPNRSRAKGAISPDYDGGNVVLFGGHPNDNSIATYNDTWIWDGDDWTEMSPATVPTGRSWVGAAYHEGLSKVVMYGGYPHSAGDETWVWDGSDWLEHFPVNHPNQYGLHTLVRFPPQDTTLLWTQWHGLPKPIPRIYVDVVIPPPPQEPEGVRVYLEPIRLRSWVA